jgi:hypothetical protein
MGDGPNWPLEVSSQKNPSYLLVDMSICCDPIRRISRWVMLMLIAHKNYCY